MSAVVALVPARAGSKRLPEKNVRVLAGHPLLAYTVAAARDSGIFDSIIVSTDSERYAELARHYGADVPWLRPASLATDESPDIEWVSHALDLLGDVSVFSILRPTSPFRTAATIRRAWERFAAERTADSLRAVERVSQHPGKMWRIVDDRLVPLLPDQPDGVPWHSRPTQSLPEVWVQNASLEIAHARCATEQGSIAGDAILPFVTEGLEGFDINSPRDLAYAEMLVAEGAELPRIAAPPAPTSG